MTHRLEIPVPFLNRGGKLHKTVKQSPFDISSFPLSTFFVLYLAEIFVLCTQAKAEASES